MSRSHEDLVESQFASQADAYVASTVHAEGADLDAIESLARTLSPRRAIDVGTGGGHVAYRLAKHAQAVVAVDLSKTMLAAVRKAALHRGLEGIETRAAPAEALPFEAESFAMLGCRFSAHHWRDFDGGLREACRVLEPGATAVFVDVVSPQHAAFDTHLQAIELLRDPSHVRNRTPAEWLDALARAGFRVRRMEVARLRMDYRQWIARMQTSQAHQAAIRSLQQSASAATARYFEIEPDGSFTFDTMLIEATRCRARDASRAS